MTRVWQDLWASWWDNFVGWFPGLVSAVLALVAFYVLWRVIDRAAAAVLRSAELDETASQFVRLVFKYTLMTVGVVTGLGQMGINTASLLTSLGVLGLTIGFAAQDTLSNVISGLFIFWDRPFSIGDLVEIDGHYGRVETITMRSTRVVTIDGRMLAIPNKNIVNSTVASYTNFPNLRLDIEVTVGSGEDLGRVRQILLDLVEDNPSYLTDRAPQVVVTRLGDFNITVELRAWLKDERKHVAETMRLREAMFEALRTAGVDMPVETFQLMPFEHTSVDRPSST